MIKKIKDRVSSDDEFVSVDAPYLTLNNGNGLFVKVWDMDFPFIYPSFKRSLLPGFKNNVSASIIGGYNIAISKYSPQENIQAALTVLNFMTSKDMQRNVVLIGKILSGVMSLYDEEEVCEVVDCELYKGIQFINRPTSKSNDYYTYSEKIRNNIYKYLYGNGNITATEILKEVDDIIRIYYVSLNSKTSSIGIILFSLFMVIALVFLLSLSLLYLEKYKSTFTFLPNDFWILIIIGIAMVIIMSYLEIAPKTTSTCYFKHILLILGITLTFIPLIYKLVIEFPLKNKFSDWVNVHRYLFLLLFLTVEMLFNLLLIIGKYDAETVRDKNGKNYQVCSSQKPLGKIVMTIEIIFMYIIILGMLIFIFLEWNIERTFYDIRILSVVCSINIIIITLFSIIKIVDIQHYMVFYIIRECIYWIYILSNYFIIYFIKIILPIIIDNNENNKNTNFLFKYYDRNSESFIKSSDISANNNSGILKNAYILHNATKKVNSTSLNSSLTSSKNSHSVVKSTNSKT